MSRTEEIAGIVGVVEEHGITMTDHPLALWDGWCGEWKERE